MFDPGFILFLLGALGYVSGLWQKPWPRKTIIILFVLYLAASFLKYKSDFETNKDLDETKSNPSQINDNSSGIGSIPRDPDKTGNILATGSPGSYKEEIDQAKENIQKGDFETALDDLNEAKKLDTDNTDIDFIKLFRIQVLIDMRDFKKALEELLQIKETDLGDNEKAWYFRYFKACYLELGDVKRAYEYDEKFNEFQNPVPDIGQRTKEGSCAVQGQLQDKACTPGFILNDSTEQICSKSHLKMNVDIPRKDKDKTLQEYGISHYNSRGYKIDYLIPIELGGADNIANLWPEAVVGPKPGFYEKKKVEKYLHDEVCAGRMSLGRAQRMMANNWLDVYKSMQ